MFYNKFHSIKTKVFLIIVLSIFLFLYEQGYAQVFVPNELNIKISQDIVKEGNAENYILFLARVLEEDLKNQDENVEVRIVKIFSEIDPESPLVLWYKIQFISKVNLDLDDIREKLLEHDEGILSAEKEFIMRSRAVPSDPGMSHLSYDYYALVGAYEAWDIELGHEDVIVAIIDSGVDVDHPDLANRFVNEDLFIRYETDSSIDPDNPTEECYLYGDDVYCFDIYIDEAELDNGALPPKHDVRDVVPHGTPIAGVIAANHNNLGIPGICPNCKLLPIKVSYLEHLEEQTGKISPFTQGTSTIGKTSEAIAYAAQNGADVINLSMSTSKDSDMLEDAVNEACEKYNCIFVAPADNEDEEGKVYPAAYNNVIGTTSIKLTAENKILKRNNAQYGTWIDIVAPGEKILSLKANSNDLQTYSGTSLSVPFVSGLAALVRSRDSNFTNHNFRQLLRESSVRIDDPLYAQNKLGYGLINLKRALDKLDDHPWDYSSTTKQGNTSSSGGTGSSSTFWPYNGYFINPYLTGYSFNPFSSFGGYGLPYYGSYPSPFGSISPPYYQQSYYPGSFGFPGGQFTQGFQPYISTNFGYPLQFGQGFVQPFSSFGLPMQLSQPGTYMPLAGFPFSNFPFGPGFQQFSPWMTFTMIPPF